jgi:hypothetical protein
MRRSDLPKTNPIEQQEKMRASRLHVIGGSDIGAIMGLSKYGCRLRVWNQKRGVKPSRPFWGNQHTERGTVLEPVAADLFAQKYGVKLRKAIPKAHRLYPELRPQSDYEFVSTAGITCQFLQESGKLGDPIVLDESWGPGILSIKCPSIPVFKKIQLEGLDEDYIMQLMYELACWGRKWGSYCFFNAEEWKIIRFDVRYDEALGNASCEYALSFMREVENGPAPDKLPPDSRACTRCEFQPTCQHDSLLALLAKDDNADHIKAGFDPSLRPLVQVLREAEEAEDSFTKLVVEAQDAIKKKLGDQIVVETPGDGVLHRIWNRPQDGRKTFQTEPFFKAHPELKAERDKFTKVGNPFRVFRVYDIPNRLGE